MKSMIYLRRIRLNRGGYEYGKYGSYYGTGQPLYRADIDIDGGVSVKIDGHWHDRSDTHECRADNRDDAKSKVTAYMRLHWPEAEVKFAR